LDVGAAFGDVLSPNWKSGSMKKGEKGKAEPTEKGKGPERGRYGAIDVWIGHLTGR